MKPGAYITHDATVSSINKVIIKDMKVIKTAAL